MPVVRPIDARAHLAHGATFRSFAAPSLGSRELCAWQLTVPPGQPGTAHRPSREEVLLVLAGDVTVVLDGRTDRLGAGDAVIVPAGGELRLDGGESEAQLWVTTCPGLRATLPDGSTFEPPWAR